MKNMGLSNSWSSLRKRLISAKMREAFSKRALEVRPVRWVCSNRGIRVGQLVQPEKDAHLSQDEGGFQQVGA
jgi:hypothetical protein